MRILLINPRSKAQDALPIPPLGILYLAAYVRDIAEIKVLDLNREWANVFGWMEWADMVGFTGTTSQFNDACTLGKLAQNLDCLTVYGGSHASALPDECLKDFDIVVVGEGEQALRSIITTGMIRGIIEFAKIDNIDALPFPARELVPILDYPTRELKRFDGAYTHMMTGRGCSSQCIFCSSPQMWGKPRLMSAERVFAEMMEVYEKYGIKNIHFQDDTFTLSKNRIYDLCTLIIDSQIEFKWSCQTRPDMVDGLLLKTMAFGGCVQIEFGVESGDAKVLKNACKGYTKKQITKAFRLAHNAGITTYGFFVVGLPGETIWTWLKSIWFALSLKMDSSVWTVLMPYPGTKVNGMVKVLDDNYSNWLYKRPIVQVGYLTPRMLSAMRWIADKVTNGFLNKGTYKKEEPKNEN